VKQSICNACYIKWLINKQRSLVFDRNTRYKKIINATALVRPPKAVENNFTDKNALFF